MNNVPTKPKKYFILLTKTAVAVAIVGAAIITFSNYEDRKERADYLARNDAYHLMDACKYEADEEAAPAVLQLTEAEILRWSENTTPDLVNFDYENARERLVDQQKNFTNEGWCKFIEAMIEARILQATSARKLAIYNELLAPPKLLPVKNAEKVWHVQMPIRVVFKDAGKTGDPVPQPIIGDLHLVIGAKGASPAITQYLMMPR